MVKGGLPAVDQTSVSVDDFFAGPVAAPVGAPFGAPAVATPGGPVVPGAAAARRRTPSWRQVAGALAILALFVVSAALLWPHASGSSGPALSTARLFGAQTRAQLPQPVTADDCKAAVHAFRGIAQDPKATAAFVDGCLHG